ncbi:MAG: hypothetical protein AAB383_02115 [Patescibacteria group bacterium]
MNDRHQATREIEDSKNLARKKKRLPEDKPLHDLIKSLAAARKEAQSSATIPNLQDALRHCLDSQGVNLDEAARERFQNETNPYLVTYLNAKGELGIMEAEAKIKAALRETVRGNKRSEAHTVLRHTNSFANTIKGLFFR